MGKGKAFVIGLVTGTLGGAIAGLLLARKPGKETWSIISSRVGGLRQVIQRGKHAESEQSLYEDTEQPVSLATTQIRQNIIEKPGVAHTELMRTVSGTRGQKEIALRELLDQGEIRREQKGRARRYFTP